MGQSSYVHLEECTIKAITKEGILIEFEGENIWLPKSQVFESDNFSPKQTGMTVSITEWIAKQKGIDVE